MTERFNARSKPIQRISGDVDIVVYSLSDFTRHASRGIPEAVEAMWSHQATTDLINDMRFSFAPDYYSTVATYTRTIRNFYAQRTKKRTRHAYRMLLNLQDFMVYGRFDPTLDEEHLERLNRLLEQDVLYEYQQ